MKSNAHQTNKRSLRGVIGMMLLLFGGSASAQKTLSDGIKDLATQLSASITKEQKQRVAVLPFKELHGQTTVLGTYLAEELLSHLVNSGLKIVERGMLDKLLGEQKLQQTGAIDAATAKQVGKVASVDAIITGSVTDLQSNVGINCRIIDTTTGDVFAAAQVKITKDDDVKKIMATVVAPAPTGTSPSPRGGQSSSAKRFWQVGDVRYVIDTFQHSGGTVTIMFGIENIGDTTQKPWVGPFYLVDENGDRWGGTSEHISSFVKLAVAAGTRRRIRFTFTPEKTASGTAFTLTDDGGNLLLRGLR